MQRIVFFLYCISLVLRLWILNCILIPSHFTMVLFFCSKQFTVSIPLQKRNLNCDRNSIIITVKCDTLAMHCNDDPSSLVVISHLEAGSVIVIWVNYKIRPKKCHSFVLFIRSDRISVHRRNSVSVCLSVCGFLVPPIWPILFQVSQIHPDQPKWTQVNPSEPIQVNSGKFR